MRGVEFGADGIRGIVGEWPFLPSVVVRIGQALGLYVRRQSERPFVVIGRDTRPSGEDLSSCLRAGLMDQGVDVISLGVMTTPGVAFITRRQGADLGVIVSASHSPFQYNGIKLVKQNGLRLQREEEIEIEALIDEFVASGIDPVLPPGRPTNVPDLIEFYIRDQIKCCPAESLEGLKVVLDCADGAASRVAPRVFRQLGAEVIVINDDMEGESINFRGGAEYVQEHPQYLAQVVQRHRAAYGFAFDGDGDRLVVVDSDGQMYDGHDLLFVLALFYRYMGLLRDDTVVTCHLSNQGLGETLTDVGIRTVYTGNGDKNLEAAMWEGNYLLGGEPGGNIIINDGHHTAADAVYTAIVLGGVLVQNQGIDLKQMTAPLRRHPQITTSIKLPIMPTYEQRMALEEECKREQAKLGKGSRILVWSSSTQPGVFRVMVEGNREATYRQVSETAQILAKFVQQIVGSSE